MSIEALLEDIYRALEKNSDALGRLEASLAGRTPVKSEDKPAVKKQEAKKEPEKVEVPAPEDDIPEFEAVPYETVRALVLKLAGAGKREEIKALNAKHGIANLKVLLDKEDDFSTVNDQVKLEAVYADLQKLEG